FPGGVAMVARGRPRFALTANIASTALTLAGVLLIRPSSPSLAAWIWFCGQILVFPYSLLATARVMHAVPLRQWRAGLAPLLIAAAATSVGWLAGQAVAGSDDPLA